MSAAPRRRVAVTGLGAVSPLGIGADALWRGILAGACAAAASPPSARGIPVPDRAAIVGDRSRGVEEIVDPRFLRRLSSFSRHAVGAAALCLRDAAPEGQGTSRWNCPGGQALRDATAVVLGTCYGSSAYHFEYYEKLFRNGIKDASPILFSESVMNAASGHISIHLKLRGASLALVGGEEVGLSAVADAADRIRLGEARAALAGGAEEYCDFVHAALAARELVANEPGIPYSSAGRGTVFGEGAALLLLEDLDAAREAGANVLAVIVGSGAARSLDGPAGAASAVESAVSRALDEAGAAPGSVGLAVTSACGTLLDYLEAEGIARALGVERGRSPGLVITAPKAALGEGFAFTSAAQALVAVQAVVTSMVPPTAGSTDGTRLPLALRLADRQLAMPSEHVLAVSLSRRGSAVAILFQRANPG